MKSVSGFMGVLHNKFYYELADINHPTFLTPGRGTLSTGAGYLTSSQPQPIATFLSHFLAPQEIINQVLLDPMSVNYTFYFRDRRISSRFGVAPETAGRDLNGGVLLASLNVPSLYRFRVNLVDDQITISDGHSTGGVSSNYGSVYGIRVSR